MKDDFDISLPPIDQLVSLAREDARVVGARMTGGGFGRAVVLLCRAGEAASTTADLVDRYCTVTHVTARALVPQLIQVRILKDRRQGDNPWRLRGNSPI
jgi:galactokinase